MAKIEFCGQKAMWAKKKASYVSGPAPIVGSMLDKVHHRISEADDTAVVIRVRAKGTGQQ